MSSRLCRWVSQFPLDSAQAVMHNIFPQTEDWSFSPVRSDVDEDIFESYIWSPTATTVNATGGPGSVSVFVQPPWILSPKDLQAFARCDAVSNVAVPCHIAVLLIFNRCLMRMILRRCQKRTRLRRISAKRGYGRK